MNQLKEKLKKLNTIIEHKKIIYIDYPVYTNIWDIAIDIATRLFLEENDFTIIKQYNTFNINYTHLSRLLRKHKDVSVVIIGWGWFTDIYDNIHFPNQPMREKLISSFREHQIVILPSSIYFQKTSRLQSCQTLFWRHPNLHLIARDHNSYDYLQHHFSQNNSYLLPDMVHRLYDTPLLKPQQWHWLLYFFRKDRESEHSHVGSDTQFDRSDIISVWDRYFTRFIMVLFIIGRYLPRSHIPYTMWYRFASKKYQQGISIINKYDRVYTDRLHGTILSLLLERHVTHYDNTTKKISSYCKTRWLKNLQ